VAVLRKRDRQIAFRVSEEEYRTLQIACLETRARSISDLAREAAKIVAASGSLSPLSRGAEQALSNIEVRIGKVEEAIELLMQGLLEIKQRLGSPVTPA
jgi:hypothetical protein